MGLTCSMQTATVNPMMPEPDPPREKETGKPDPRFFQLLHNDEVESVMDFRENQRAISMERGAQRWVTARPAKVEADVANSTKKETIENSSESDGAENCATEDPVASSTKKDDTPDSPEKKKEFESCSKESEGSTTRRYQIIKVTKMDQKMKTNAGLCSLRVRSALKEEEED